MTFQAGLTNLYTVYKQTVEETAVVASTLGTELETATRCLLLGKYVRSKETRVF